MNKTILCVLTAIFGGAATVLAIPTTLDIDFRSSAWSPANGTGQDTVGNVTAAAAYPPGSALTWSSTAGLGINSPSLLGLGTIDILNVTLSGGAGQGLNGVWVTNLFNGLTDESGLLALNTTAGTDYIGFLGLQTKSQNPLGDVYVGFGGSYNVLSASFYEVNALAGLTGNQNYSVAGFSRVPDGGPTLALLGIGLISLMAFHRRFAF
jgi:hypothetical protein